MQLRYFLYLCKEKIVSMENKVKYVSGIRTFGNEVFPERTTKNIESRFVQKYFNILSYLGGLNSCSRDLIDYLTEVMDEDNIVYNNAIIRNNFLTYMKEVTLKKEGTFVVYSDVNIRKSFQTLQEKECLLKLTKGMYKVNPEIFFRGGEKDRIESIKFVMEFNSGVRNPSMETIVTFKETEVEYKKPS
jgi:hypothetical protein